MKQTVIFPSLSLRSHDRRQHATGAGDGVSRKGLCLDGEQRAQTVTQPWWPWALALVPQGPRCLGGRCSHGASAPSLHWADFHAPWSPHSYRICVCVCVCVAGRSAVSSWFPDFVDLWWFFFPVRGSSVSLVLWIIKSTTMIL